MSNTLCHLCMLSPCRGGKGPPPSLPERKIVDTLPVGAKPPGASSGVAPATAAAASKAALANRSSFHGGGMMKRRVAWVKLVWYIAHLLRVENFKSQDNRSCCCLMIGNLEIWSSRNKIRVWVNIKATSFYFYVSRHMKVRKRMREVE